MQRNQQDNDHLSTELYFEMLEYTIGEISVRVVS